MGTFYTKSLGAWYPTQRKRLRRCGNVKGLRREIIRDYAGGAVITTRVLPGEGQRRRDRGGRGHSDTEEQATKGSSL